MTLPVKADWAAGNTFAHSDENAIAAAVNALGAGTLTIPARANVSSAATLTVTTAYNVWVFTGSTSTWTLPAVSAGTYSLTLVNRGTGVLTIQRAGSNQILSRSQLVTSVQLPKGNSLRMVSDGTYWVILGGGGAGGSAPVFDNAVSGPGEWNTWTHNVGASGADQGAGYAGLLVVTGQTGHLGAAEYADLNLAGSSVTFGGISCPYLGYGYGVRTGYETWTIVFGATGIPAGNQSVVAHIAFSQNALSGVITSVTYADCGFIARAQTGGGNIAATYLQNGAPYGEEFFRVTRAPGVAVITNDISGNNLTLRKDTTCDLGVAGGDNVTVAGYMEGGATWSAVCLELLQSQPTEPYINSVGAGIAETATNPTWSHTADAGSYVLVGIYGTTSAATYDGAAMDLLGSSGSLKLYGKANVAGGAKNVHITGSGYQAGTSLGLSNVTSIDTPVTKSGTSTGSSQAMTCTPGQLILDFIGSTAYSQGFYDPGFDHIWAAVTQFTNASIEIAQHRTSTTFQWATSWSCAWNNIAVVIS